jgi:PST family polysaccharide transporter
LNYFGDNQASDSLGRQSVRSGAITVFARGINAVLQVGSVLFLARLLTPEDYGLVAMVTALTGFAPVLVDMGTRDAVVQRVKISESEVSTLFWLTLAFGCLMALTVSAASPLIAHFYHEPRLISIVCVSSVTFIAVALTAQHQGLLRRAVMFRELAIIDICANVLGAGGAVTFAWFGFGYWALVTRPVATFAFTAIGTWICCRWRPRRPAMTRSVGDMVRFGLNLSGFSATDFVARNSDRVTVGRSLGARSLGYYQNALFIYDNLLDLLVFPLHQVAAASLSKLQNDLEALRRSWAKALSTVAFYAMPAFGVLAVVSQDLVVLLLGAKWASAGVILSVLALRGIPHCVERTLGWLHVAAGRTDRWFKWGVTTTCVQLGVLFLGIHYGIMGVVYVYVAFMFLWFIPAIAFAGRPLGIRARDVIRVVGAQLVGSVSAAAAGFLLRQALMDLPSIERLFILSVAYLATYLIIVLGVFRETTPLNVCLSVARDFMPAGLKPSRRVALARPSEEHAAL